MNAARPAAPRNDGTEDHDPVLGLDNVALELPLAGLASRFLATVLDLLAILVALAFVGLGLALLVAWLDLGAAWAIGLFLFALFLLQFGYFSICEIATEGRTFGKAVIGLRTVSSLGGQPSAAALLVRNLLRPFDFLLGWPMIAIDRRHRRIGDLVASTLVVHLHADPRGLVRIGRAPPSWTQREIAVVESFLGRAERMEPERAAALADRLATWIRRQEPELVPAADPPFEDPLQLLREWLDVEVSER